MGYKPTGMVCGAHAARGSAGVFAPFVQASTQARTSAPVAPTSPERSSPSTVASATRSSVQAITTYSGPRPAAAGSGTPSPESPPGLVGTGATWCRGWPAVRAHHRLPPEPDVGAGRPDLDALHEQPHDARLLGREQLVPQRVEPLQRLPDLGLGQVRRLRPR